MNSMQPEDLYEIRRNGTQLREVKLTDQERRQGVFLMGVLVGVIVSAAVLVVMEIARVIGAG